MIYYACYYVMSCHVVLCCVMGYALYCYVIYHVMLECFVPYIFFAIRVRGLVKCGLYVHLS